MPKEAPKKQQHVQVQSEPIQIQHIEDPYEALGRVRASLDADAMADELLSRIRPEAGPLVGGMGPDAETVYNEKGAGQSHLPYRFDLIDAKAMFKIAEVLDEGAKKYGADNWRGIPLEDHLNHLIAHAYAYLAGDRSDDHLAHLCCRAIFAQGVVLQGEK